MAISERIRADGSAMSEANDHGLPGSTSGSLLNRLVDLRPVEGGLVAWAWAYLYCVFPAYS